MYFGEVLLKVMILAEESGRIRENLLKKNWGVQMKWRCLGLE